MKSTAKKPKCRIKTLAPRDAKTFDEVRSLKTDNFHVKNGWILVYDDVVCLFQQIKSRLSTTGVGFNKKEFNKLVDWYQRPQKVKEKK